MFSCLSSPLAGARTHRSIPTVKLDEAQRRSSEPCTLRQFTDFYCLPVPQHDAFHRGFVRLTPETLRAVNDLVVQAAVDLGLEDGQKLRVDTTVVQTDIHHLTDSTLLWDVVRVVTRLIGQLAAAPDARASTDDHKAASGSANHDISRTDRHGRGGHQKRTSRTAANRKKKPFDDGISVRPEFRRETFWFADAEDS